MRKPTTHCVLEWHFTQTWGRSWNSLLILPQKWLESVKQWQCCWQLKAIVCKQTTWPTVSPRKNPENFPLFLPPLEMGWWRLWKRPCCTRYFTCLFFFIWHDVDELTNKQKWKWQLWLFNMLQSGTVRQSEECLTSNFQDVDVMRLVTILQLLLMMLMFSK